MEITKSLESGKLTLTVSGEIDTLTAPRLDGEVETEGLSELVFDLTDVTYVSSAGLRVLQLAHKKRVQAGGKMTITHPQEAVRRVFTLTGFAKILTIV